MHNSVLVVGIIIGASNYPCVLAGNRKPAWQQQALPELENKVKTDSREQHFCPARVLYRHVSYAAAPSSSLLRADILLKQTRSVISVARTKPATIRHRLPRILKKVAAHLLKNSYTGRSHCSFLPVSIVWCLVSRSEINGFQGYFESLSISFRCRQNNEKVNCPAVGALVKCRVGI